LPTPKQAQDRLAAHWRRLCLAPDAPECVIKAAHRYQIELHHPDRGGSVQDAQQINAAFDELKGRGSKANEHVARFYDGEPWHILGLMSNADRTLVERVGRQLAGDLDGYPRLARRVEWAVEHFGEATHARPRVQPPPAPPQRRRYVQQPPPQPAPPPMPGRPEGMPEVVDFGKLAWRSEQRKDVRLTWKRDHPAVITVDAPAPLRASVSSAKTVPGRFVISLSIDWDAPAFSHDPKLAGYSMDVTVTVRWPGDEATFKALGTLLYPAQISASPTALDLGAVAMGQKLRTTLLLISTAPATAEIESSAWLARADAAGRRVETPLRLSANTPVRVAFDVVWEPIEERVRALAHGKPVRPTGKITVRWDGRELEVPAQMVVRRR